MHVAFCLSPCWFILPNTMLGVTILDWLHSLRKPNEYMTDEIQNQDQPTEGIPFYWVTFADDSQQKIASAHSGPIPRSSEEIKLPANDPRVLALIDPPETHRIIKWRIHDLDQLSKLAYLFDTGTPKPVYRGQSNYAWPLETRLERLAPEFVKKESGLEIFEYQTITEAKRRLHHHLSALPEDEDLLSWLALLRHHGVPTRLLDVTKSLFVACYFAVRNAIPKQDAALWIFPRMPFDSAYSEWCLRRPEAIFRDSPFTAAEYGEYYWPFPKSFSRPVRIIDYDSLRELPDAPWLKFTSVLEAAMLGYIAKPGAAIAEPYWLPKRMDVQQGAFIIPFNVRHSLEKNLFS